MKVALLNLTKLTFKTVSVGWYVEDGIWSGFKWWNRDGCRWSDPGVGDITDGTVDLASLYFLPSSSISLFYLLTLIYFVLQFYDFLSSVHSFPIIFAFYIYFCVLQQAAGPFAHGDILLAGKLMQIFARSRLKRRRRAHPPSTFLREAAVREDAGTSPSEEEFCSSLWSSARRTHLLINGDVFWKSITVNQFNIFNGTAIC
jgi:hypothetical protein